ncbi:MAG: hypothetical protein HY318_00880 [Armatimonadetes bacterium]|nr:hypothetical protein [Armatimonadota bacterium]
MVPSTASSVEARQESEETEPTHAAARGKAPGFSVSECCLAVATATLPAIPTPPP